MLLSCTEDLKEKPLIDKVPEIVQEIKNDTVYRSISIVSFSIMSSLSVCIIFSANLMDHIKNYFPEQQLPNTQKELFEHGLSLSTFCTLFFRGGHNIIFASFLPKTRFMIALLCMVLSMVVIIVAFFIIETQQIWWIYIAYALAGLSFGCNEPNLFRSTSHLGDVTTQWIFYGLAIGYNLTTVVGLFALSIGMSLIYMYIWCAIMCILSTFLYLSILSHHNKYIESNAKRLNKSTSSTIVQNLGWNDFKMQIKEWRQWLTKILGFSVVMLLSYFSLSCFGTLPLYVMESNVEVPILPNIWMNRNLLFSLNGILGIISTLLSYKILDSSMRLSQFIEKYPFVDILIHVVGGVLASCILLIQPLLAVCGTTIVNFAFGLIYKSSVKYIENRIDARYRLVALSVAFMFGDIGATFGVNTWPFIVDAVCKNTTKSYYCDND